jgi:regulator of sigma E protease
MLNVLGFLIILGPLVVAHEFGHYIFARIFGVKAEIFSIGFGKKIWSRQLGETELRVSMIPLGGYVKLLGEDREAPLPPELKNRALHRQAPWKRFFIFFGGPLFNFLFAILIYMTIMAVGEPQISNRVARVVRGSPAALAGFQSGDRVLSVDGKPVKRYDDLMDIVEDNAGKALVFEVVHPGAPANQSPVRLTATPHPEDGYSLYGEPKQVGEVVGLIPYARSTQIGVSDPRSVAGTSGIQSGDALVDFNGTPVKTFEEIEGLYAQATPKSAIALKIEKPNKSVISVVFSKPAGDVSMEKAWGLRSSEMFIEKVVDGSPAALAGLHSGDRIVTVGKKELQSFFDLKDEVQKSGETEGKVPLTWEHEGKLVSATVIPTSTSNRNALLKKTTGFTVGIVPMLETVEPEMAVERIWNPLVLLYKGTERMILFSWRNLVSIQKIITGDVSVATLGGPIMIGKIAGESLSRGLIAFLSNMAILSIGLGVLNVLPIPVLDGGHLMLLAIETVRGKPLTMRTMEIIQSVGLTAILLLMALVMKNDFTRIFS